MKRFDDILHHFIHYGLLLAILLVGLSVYFAAYIDKGFRLWVVAGISVSYILWGIGHHHLSHRQLHIRIVVEYLLIGALGFVLMKGILGL